VRIPEARRVLAEKAREIDPETLKQISVFDPEDLKMPDPESSQPTIGSGRHLNMNLVDEFCVRRSFLLDGMRFSKSGKNSERTG